ncbi:hypothetical protein [Leifsonia virtsii]|uniref:HK97 gp10 family phage protein n=1 Tax=Leifsonia virtsii TaxID=3035915 RepID=A0ABT8J188_9MICO|nr:hypothetical protein [Leifsonia virtsii]MDN4598845.1 hypothetical protein [Leifsonia virtsii]
MALRISVFASKELQQTIAILKGVDKDISKAIRIHIRSITSGEWAEAVRGRTSNAQEVKVLANTARVLVSNQNITLRAGHIGKALSGGAKPSDIVRPVEFGAPQNTVNTYTARSRKGKTFRVTRHTNRQFRGPSRTGYAVYPAASKVIPRIASLFVQTTIRTFFEGFERAGRG